MCQHAHTKARVCICTLTAYAPQNSKRLVYHVCGALQIIMDGNSRWATRQGLPAFVGHERGVAALKSAVITSKEWGIPALTVRAQGHTSTVLLAMGLCMASAHVASFAAGALTNSLSPQYTEPATCCIEHNIRPSVGCIVASTFGLPLCSGARSAYMANSVGVLC
jgi:hypothetical protein